MEGALTDFLKSESESGQPFTVSGRLCWGSNYCMKRTKPL